MSPKDFTDPDCSPEGVKRLLQWLFERLLRFIDLEAGKRGCEDRSAEVLDCVLRHVFTVDAFQKTATSFDPAQAPWTAYIWQRVRWATAQCFRGRMNVSQSGLDEGAVPAPTNPDQESEDRYRKALQLLLAGLTVLLDQLKDSERSCWTLAWCWYRELVEPDRQAMLRYSRRELADLDARLKALLETLAERDHDRRQRTTRMDEITTTARLARMQRLEGKRYRQRRELLALNVPDSTLDAVERIAMELTQDQVKKDWPRAFPGIPMRDLGSTSRELHQLAITCQSLHFVRTREVEPAQRELREALGDTERGPVQPTRPEMAELLDRAVSTVMSELSRASKQMAGSSFEELKQAWKQAGRGFGTDSSQQGDA